MTRNDITTREDISILVSTFYDRAFADPLIGYIFTDIAHLDLVAHMPTMCDFWESVIFRAGKYHGNAMQPHYLLHLKSPLTHAHFERWLEIWKATTDDLFEGEYAEFAKQQATSIAFSMYRRLSRHSSVEPLTIQFRGAS